MILNQSDTTDLINFATDALDYGPDYEDNFQKANRFDQVLDNNGVTEKNILQSLCDYNVD